MQTTMAVGVGPTSVQLAVGHGSITSNLSSSSSPSELSFSCIQPRFLLETTIETHTRIRNLTGQVSAISRFAVLYGGFSDIYSGELKGRKVSDSRIYLTYIHRDVYDSGCPQVAPCVHTNRYRRRGQGKKGILSVNFSFAC